MKSLVFRATFVASLLILIVALDGCGTVQESSNGEDWAATPPVSVTARLEYRVDSLTNENRRLRQQLDALQSENSNINKHLTELQATPSTAGELNRSMSPASSSPSPIRKMTAPGGYESALTKFRKKDFKGSIDEFRGLLKGGISDDLADNCHYWIGESYFAMKNYASAIESFKTVIGMAGSDKADDAQLMIGNSYAAMGKKTQAKEAFQKVISMFPSSPLAKRARAKLNSL